MADIRNVENQADLHWTGLHQKTAGHDVASLNAHSHGNRPTRKWVGIEAEIDSYLRGGRSRKIRLLDDGVRYYFCGDFGSFTFEKGHVGADFFESVVVPNLEQKR